MAAPCASHLIGLLMAVPCASHLAHARQMMSVSNRQPCSYSWNPPHGHVFLLSLNVQELLVVVGYLGPGGVP